MRKICLAAFSLCSLASLLTGCTSGVPSVVTPTVKSTGMSGSVHGGNQPVSGATIQIYAPGTTGYGSTATALITGAPLLTAADGSFNFGNRGLVCPSGPTGQDRLYMTATGGNPGFGGVVNNDALFLMTIIDSCQALTTSSFFSVSEVSTVASIYALAQFMNPTTGSIGAYGSSTTGINNAFDTAVTLFNPATGSALAVTPSGIGLVPQATIDTLANIITPCVNSNGSVSAACTALFQNTTNTLTSNTGLATLRMALSPGTNVSSLYTLASANAPFQPALTSAPNDLTLSVSYNTGASVPTSLAIDGIGNIWIADFKTGAATSKLLKFSPQMVAVGSPINAQGITSIAIDSQNNVWAVDPIDNYAEEFNNSGNAVTTLTATRGGNMPQAIAIDSGDNPWITDSGSHVSEVHLLDLNTIAYSGVLVNPTAIAFDNAGNAWMPNTGANSISKVTAAGVDAGTYTGGGLSAPGAVAIDSTGHIYAGNTSGGALSEFNSTGVPVSASGYSFPSAGNSINIAVDGSGNLWSAGTNNLLSEISGGNLVSPTTGYKSPGVNQPDGISIDASGNVWVLDKTQVSQNGTSVNLTNFVGLATPATMPLAAAVRSGQVGAPAGTPIPVTVATTALPYFTPGTPYFANLQGSGGTGSYVWSYTGLLPTGLSMSSAGVISGTPTGIFTTPNFTVADAALPSNNASRAISISPNTVLPIGAQDGNLNGQYAVLIKGFKGGTTSTTGGTNGFAAIGSLNFDGVGNITGEMDYSGADGNGQTANLSGRYMLGADLRGTILLTSVSTGSIPRQFAFSVADSFRTLYLTDMEYTGSGTYPIASGIGKRQTLTDFTTATMNQTFVFGLDGETACTTCGTAVAPYYGTISMAGRMVINGTNSITGIVDEAALNMSYAQVPISSGGYTAPDATRGRGTLSLLIGAGSVVPNYDPNYVYYVVNANEIMMMATDFHIHYNLLSGDAIVQTQTFSSTASANNGVFNGNYLIEQTSAKGGDGTATFPKYSDPFIVMASSTGTGTVTVVQDENQAGLITTEQTLGTLNYSIDQNGRFSVGPISIYFADGTRGFGTELPSSGNTGSAGLLVVEQQIGALSCATPTGAFSFGSVAPVIPQSVSSGVITFTGGTGAATIDTSDPSGTLVNGATSTFTCSSDAVTGTLGRLTYTDSAGNPNVGYLVSPTKLVLVGTKANDTKAGLTVVTAQ